MQTGPSGLPARVRLRAKGVRSSVREVEDRWRIDDEWWREQPIARTYYQLRLEDGRRLVLYLDQVAECWSIQRP